AWPSGTGRSARTPRPPPAAARWCAGMAELSCTCGPGETVAGTRQEIIEQRLAPLFGMTIHEIHVVLDLLDRALDAVLDEFPEGVPDRAAWRRRAAESGGPEGGLPNFRGSWEFVSGGADPETPGPLPPLGTNPRFAERK